MKFIKHVCEIGENFLILATDEAQVVSDCHSLADPAVGFVGGQLGEVTQARVPPKLKTPRIWPTIFGGVAQNHVQK